MASGEADPPSLNRRIYSKVELEDLASAFLRKFHKPPDSLPVDIELITERDLGIQIIPFASLQLLYGIEAFITLSRKTIYVDPFLMDLDQNERRYRFTIAEEVAHGIIHQDLFKGIKKPEDYLALYNQLNPETYRWMDRNAKYLAGAILMPGNLFEAKATELFQQLPASPAKSTKLSEIDQIRIIAGLADLFQVSQYSAAIRFSHLGLDRRLGST